MTDEECCPDELRTLFLFEKLTDAQLEWLCQRGRVEVIPAGLVYAEGDPATHFYVLLDGSVVLSRRVGGDDIEAAPTSQRGVYAGAWQAYLSDQVLQRYPCSMRVTEPSRFFILDADVFSQLMNEWFPLAVHLLGGGFVYGTNLRELAGQRDAGGGAAETVVDRGDRTADERDRGRRHADLRPGRRGQAVQPPGPGPLPGRRPARAAGQHAGDAGGEDFPGYPGGQGV